MKTCGYGKGDKKQFWIDRIDSKKGNTKDHIQFFFFGVVIVRRKIDFKNICIY